MRFPAVKKMGLDKVTADYKAVPFFRTRCILCVYAVVRSQNAFSAFSQLSQNMSDPQAPLGAGPIKRNHSNRFRTGSDN